MALIAAHLNAGHSGADSVAIGTYSPSPTQPPYPLPLLSPSLISLMVSVDVKHHVSYYMRLRQVQLCDSSISMKQTVTETEH